MANKMQIPGRGGRCTTDGEPRKTGKPAVFLLAVISWGWGLGAISPVQALEDPEIRTAATHFLQRPFFAKGTAIAGVEPPAWSRPCWLVRLKPSGFILFSDDTRELPIIAFSPQGVLDMNPESPWGAALARVGSGTSHDERGPVAWRRLLEPASVLRMGEETPANIRMEPLLATHWSQWSPFNRQCPVVTNALPGYGGRAPTGCVPVALGQVMRYYNWPQKGNGVSVFTDAKGACTGTYTAIWTNLIDWVTMKDRYDNQREESPELVNPLADLMARLGVLAETDYEGPGSGADISTGARGMTARLGYTMGEVAPAGGAVFNWALETEILNRRPVLLDLNVTPGHTVVADGLAEDGGVKFVHLNYGWGGTNDGWYASYTNSLFKSLLTTLRPNTAAGLLACSPNYLELTTTNSQLPDFSLQLAGIGAPNLSYALASPVPWISILPASGANLTQAVAHVVHVEGTQLAYGTNDAYVEITGSASNLPRRVALRIYRPDPPVITRDQADVVSYFPTNNFLSIKASAGAVYAPYIMYDVVNYQWYYNGQPLPGQTESWCETIGFGTYQCEISTLGGRLKSREIVVARPAQGSAITLLEASREKLLLQIDNVQNGRCYIQSSPDLKNWTDLGSLAVPPGTQARIEIPVSKNNARRFYRVRE